MRWMRNAQHSGADHHPAVEKAHALQAMLGATRLSLQTRHLVRLRRSNVTTFHRPVCRCDCRPRLFGHELIAKDGRPGSGGPFCCTILTTLPPHSAMSARIHVFVTKEMKLPVMLVENDTGPPRLVGGHTRSAGGAACRLSERTLTYSENPLPVGSLDWS